MKGKVSVTYKPERQKLTNQQKREFIAANSRAFGGQFGVREICEHLHIGTKTYARLKLEELYGVVAATAQEGGQ